MKFQIPGFVSQMNTFYYPPKNPSNSVDDIRQGGDWQMPPRWQLKVIRAFETGKSRVEPEQPHHGDSKKL